jgi:hypothetical protein
LLFVQTNPQLTPIRIEIVLATMKDNSFCKRPLRLIREAPSELDLWGLQIFHDILARKLEGYKY